MYIGLDVFPRCSQEPPRYRFYHHNGLQVTPKGSNLRPQGHHFEDLEYPKCPPEAHFDTQRAPFGHLVGILGPPRLDFVTCWTSCCFLSHVFWYCLPACLSNDMLQTTLEHDRILLIVCLVRKVDLEKTLVITI